MNRRPTIASLITLAASLMISLEARHLPAAAINGAFTIHQILKVVGEEHYYLASNADGTRTLTTSVELSDRGRQSSTMATLLTTGDERPLSLEIKSGTAVTNVAVDSSGTTLRLRGVTSTVPTPPAVAGVMGASPFALQMMMMRSWHARGEPRQLSLFSANAQAEPLEIVRVGRDTIEVGGKRVALDRYTVAGLMFGREIVWTTSSGELAAAMTFAGGLPLEAVRTDLEAAFPQLYKAGVAQELANLTAIDRAVPPLSAGAYAITGATLIDGVSETAVPDAVVIIRNGRIAAAGPRRLTPVPPGLHVIDAHGETLLPGLWEMHTHASGIEFGPAHLAAGITTARDLGGEMDFLVAVRDAIEKRNATGPRLLLAGLIDAGGARAFGHVTAETPELGRAAVQRYHDARFQQVKLYTYLTADVVRAIATEAHRLGLRVSGHVPQALSSAAGIEAGMDEVNHLNYITSMLRAPGAAAGSAPDLQSPTAQSAIKFLLDHHTVVDPTMSWGEMAGHSRDIDLASIEPGILQAPAILDAKFRGMTGASTVEQARAFRAQTGKVIMALHRAGVPIVPGSDTGLVGFGLHRELELYVEAGMTPFEAIQAATIVSARAMGLERDSGTIEAGKRADLILVGGDPLKDIRALRGVTRVITAGRLYDAGALWRSIGFRPR